MFFIVDILNYFLVFFVVVFFCFLFFCSFKLEKGFISHKNYIIVQIAALLYAHMTDTFIHRYQHFYYRLQIIFEQEESWKKGSVSNF